MAKSIKELRAARQARTARATITRTPPVSGGKSNISIAFARSLTVWNQRRRRMGDGAVGRQGEDAIAQGRRIEEQLRWMLSGQHFEHALDFGCGWGRFSPRLIEHCQHLWSVDLFRDWVERASAYPTATGKVLDSPQLPLDSRSVNLILDIMTFQSIESDLLSAHYAAELRRVAVPGARFISLYKRGDSWARDQMPKALGLRDYNPAYFSVGTEEIDEDGASYYFLVGEITDV